MTSITTSAPSSLERNLHALGERNAAIIEAIRQAPRHAEIEFDGEADGRPLAKLNGRQLCSRRPEDEAARLIDPIDVREHGTFVFFGLGLGYHVERLARTIRDEGLIIIFEPDVQLLRTVLEEIDHSDWIRQSRVILVTDPQDQADLTTRLHGLDMFLGIGMEFINHPSSRARLDPVAGTFSRTLRDHVNGSRTMMMTTLIRSVDTVRNLLQNLDHYVGGAGILDLKDQLRGRPAVLVAAGPSLQKNIEQLAQPGVRDRCVIIAVQTTLKPLLNAGIKPHFVTALDYHEISKRFYEGITADDVRDVTLICDPKVNPVVIDAFPGPVRCAASGFLDQVLGPAAREMGSVAAGATVAHLSLYLARYFGCDPVIMIGQDLGFPDGLYYTSGTAIHDVWAPELNPFNTIEMMEWRRIAACRPNLFRKEDHRGRLIYSDAQMSAYLQHFERDFLQQERDGLRVIDATEGGVRKQHTTIMPLAEALEKFAQSPLPEIPLPGSTLQSDRLRQAERQVDRVRREVLELREVCNKTVAQLNQMLRDQHDKARMDRHFRKIDQYRGEVERRANAFSLLNNINQLGAFKRARVDRRKRLSQDLEPMEVQRIELERDRENVTWINDAAEEFMTQLTIATRVLRGESVPRGRRSNRALLKAAGLDDGGRQRTCTVAAMMPVDPERNGLGHQRSLAEPFCGRPVIQVTLERLARTEKINEIILIVPHDLDVESLIDRSRIGKSLTIERCDGSPFPREQASVAAARALASHSWRHGLAGASAYDEVLCPQVMAEIMQRREIDAALLVAPDWPLIDTSEHSGCDAVIARYLEMPGKRPLVFTQHPPGLGPCVVARSLIEQMTDRNRAATIGSHLTLQPQRPQFDIITHSPCVQIDHRMRHSMIRATFDSNRQRELLRRAIDDPELLAARDAMDFVARIERAAPGTRPALPRHVLLELNTARITRGRAHRHPFGEIDRPDLDPAFGRAVIEACAADRVECITFAGIGDPLLHPDCTELIQHAKTCGIPHVHLRTELRAGPETDRAAMDARLEKLLRSGVDIISVDLHANSPEVYQQMLGSSDLNNVMRSMEYIVAHQNRLTNQDGTAAMVLPWLVPRMQRCTLTYEEIEPFFDRWMYLLGAAVIDPEPDFAGVDGWTPDELNRPRVPRQVLKREILDRMVVFADGSVPISETDWMARDTAGRATETSLVEIWKGLGETRLDRLNHEDPNRHPRICFA